MTLHWKIWSVGSAALLVACSLSDDPELSPRDRPDGGAGQSGEGGRSGEGGTSGSAGSGNPECSDGELSCGGVNGNAILRCMDGKWTEREVCGGSTPVCNDGTCAGLRIHGGLQSFGVRPAEHPSFVLKAQSINIAPRACNADLCVTGELR